MRQRSERQPAGWWLETRRSERQFHRRRPAGKPRRRAARAQHTTCFSWVAPPGVVKSVMFPSNKGATQHGTQANLVDPASFLDRIGAWRGTVVDNHTRRRQVLSSKW